MKLGYLPLDVRPVNWGFVERLAASVGVSLLLPSPACFGVLKQPACLAALTEWLQCSLPTLDGLLIGLDTWTYGGLIPSRVSVQSAQQVLDRQNELLAVWKKAAKPHASLLGFSSILRCPAYNSSEEEPEYWATYGQALHQYSVVQHQQSKKQKKEQRQALPYEALLQVNPVLAEQLGIPLTVLSNWLTRLQTRWQGQQYWVKHVQEGLFEALVFCADDTGRYGLGVAEGEALSALLGNAPNANRNAWVQTGADELGVSLLARACLQNQAKPTVWVMCSSLLGLQVNLPFDGVTVDACVQQRLQALGVKQAATPEEADLWLLLHTPTERNGVGDHCSQTPAHLEAEPQAVWVENTLQQATALGKGVVLADLAYANGSDPALMRYLLHQVPQALGNLYGYAGWNTPGNTLGCALAMGALRWHAEQHNTCKPPLFKQVLLERFVEDWLYQAEVRLQLRQQTGYVFGEPDPPAALNTALLNHLLKPGMTALKTLLGLEALQASAVFPCQRTFDIELTFE